MKKQALILLLLPLFACTEQDRNSQGEDFTSNVNKVGATITDDSDQLTFFRNPRQPIAPRFQQFPTGSVQPEGWILEMMKQDLAHGVTGALDELYPGIKSDDIYNKARRGGLEDVPEMGDLVLTGAEWEQSIMWWNSETIGNWWDGFIRHAFLTKDRASVEQAERIIQNLLDSQDEDGYIGIYKPNLRYQHEGSNGELWAQTTAFRAMLAYFEFTNAREVLDAVEKGMQVTIAKYGPDGKNPFELKNAFGGVTHGLMLTDVCETLYRLTEKQEYQDYATYLYEAFSAFSVNRSFNDLRYPFLIEKDVKFEGHGVHTYEHIRSMANAYYNTGYPELRKAYEHMLLKLEPCLLPSGAGHGNEWIAKLKAHPDHTSSEYCTMLELRNSYGSLIQKTGDVAFADDAEKLTYNAMIGFRNEEGTAITYGKPDNCYVLDGKHHEHGESREDPRYKYSPTHSEPAVCCVPNYGRNLTYFLEQMWMKSEGGIAVVMFGPSKLTTEINGTQVTITQETNYPLSDEVTFRFELDRPAAFDFYIRRPAWSEGLEDESVFDGLENGYYKVSKEWENNDHFTIRFKNEVKLKQAGNEEVYIQRGPLVYAYSIPHHEEVIKTYEEKAFSDYYCFPTEEDYKHLALNANTRFDFKGAAAGKSFYDADVHLEAQLFNAATNSNSMVQLVPMGKTVLRRITFPQN